MKIHEFEVRRHCQILQHFLQNRAYTWCNATPTPFVFFSSTFFPLKGSLLPRPRQWTFFSLILQCIFLKKVFSFLHGILEISFCVTSKESSKMIFLETWPILKILLNAKVILVLVKLFCLILSYEYLDLHVLCLPPPVLWMIHEY